MDWLRPPSVSPLRGNDTSGLNSGALMMCLWVRPLSPSLPDGGEGVFCIPYPACGGEGGGPAARKSVPVWRFGGDHCWRHVPIPASRRNSSLHLNGRFVSSQQKIGPCRIISKKMETPVYVHRSSSQVVLLWSNGQHSCLLLWRS